MQSLTYLPHWHAAVVTRYFFIINQEIPLSVGDSCILLSVRVLSEAIRSSDLSSTSLYCIAQIVR